MNTQTIVEKIIDIKFFQHAVKEFDDYELIPVELSFEEWNNYEPTEDDLPSIMESLKYWATAALPPGEAKNWNKLQCEIANECNKKELILYELLGKAMRSRFF